MPVRFTYFLVNELITECVVNINIYIKQPIRRFMYMPMTIALHVLISDRAHSHLDTELCYLSIVDLISSFH